MSSNKTVPGPPRSSSAVKRHACTEEGYDKTFTSIKSRKIHMRMRTGEEPYFCFDCERSFKWRSGLVFHRRRTDCSPFAYAFIRRTEQRAQPPRQAGQTAPPPDMRGAIDAFVTQLQQQQVNLWHDADQTQSAAINAALLCQQQVHPTLQEQQRILQQDGIERQQGKQVLKQIQRQFQLSAPEEQQEQTAQSLPPDLLDSQNSTQPDYATQDGMHSDSTPQPAMESHGVCQAPQQAHAYFGYSEPATSNCEQLYYPA